MIDSLFNHVRRIAAGWWKFRYRVAVWRGSVHDFFWRLRRTGVYRSDGVRVMFGWWFLGVDPYEEREAGDD